MSHAPHLHSAICHAPLHCNPKTWTQQCPALHHTSLPVWIEQPVAGASKAQNRVMQLSCTWQNSRVCFKQRDRYNLLIYICLHGHYDSSKTAALGYHMRSCTLDDFLLSPAGQFFLCRHSRFNILMHVVHYSSAAYHERSAHSRADCQVMLTGQAGSFQCIPAMMHRHIAVRHVCCSTRADHISGPCC
jgi:hypothetical protein